MIRADSVSVINPKLVKVTSLSRSNDIHQFDITPAFSKTIAQVYTCMYAAAKEKIQTGKLIKFDSATY